VQSGFPEAIHSRHIERYLNKLAKRLGCPYAGTLVKGGGEGTRDLPDKMAAPLYTNIYQLGQTLGAKGRFDPEVLKKLAGTERFPAYLLPIVSLFLRSPWSNTFFDKTLKKNGVFDQRYAQPYKET
jgi:hypothetical protein